MAAPPVPGLGLDSDDARGRLPSLSASCWSLPSWRRSILALHMLITKLIRNPESKLLAFLTIMTHPLTAPARSFLAPGTPESRVRGVTLRLSSASGSSPAPS